MDTFTKLRQLAGDLTEPGDNATAVASYLAAGGTAYSGPNELKPGLPNLAEAELTGDFEAVLTWVLGVNEEADFRVLTLESPARLVVDVGHP